LALVLYEKIMPGSQLANRLQDLGYRAQSCADAAAVVTCAENEGPMLILADLHNAREDVCALIAKLKRDSATRHIPVIAFAAEDALPLQDAARNAGATLVVNEAAVVNHLPQLLERALRVE
jgi:CheY-like chemotaxis protein